MTYFVIGLNHHSAPLSIRERIAFTPTELAHQLPLLRSKLDASLVQNAQVNKQAAPTFPSQICMLSTCNRLEVYLVTDHDRSAVIQQIGHWLGQYNEIDFSAISPYLYCLADEEAVLHAFAVASGMDSMVLGEPQILGQFKAAYQLALQSDTMGTQLQTMLEKSFSVAKEVRTQTSISEHSVSMAAAAVKLAKRVFEDFQKLHVLLLGAGEMMDVVAQHIIGQAPSSITVANRSLENAQHLILQLANTNHRINMHAMRLNELPENMAQFDFVVTCTASQLPIISFGMIEQALKRRRFRPIILVDLGVPRDIDSAVNKLDDAFLYTVDDLADIVAVNSAHREAALSEAQIILDREIIIFNADMARREHRDGVVSLRKKANKVAQDELLRAQGQLQALIQKNQLPASSVDQITALMQSLTNRITNKYLHEPTLGLQDNSPELRAAWQKTMDLWLKSHDED